jgi:hypothetical protein
MGAAAVTAVALYLILIPAYGMNGAALASTITYVGIFAASLVLFVRASGVGVRETLVPDRTDFERYGRWMRALVSRGTGSA